MCHVWNLFTFLLTLWNHSLLLVGTLRRTEVIWQWIYNPDYPFLAFLDFSIRSKKQCVQYLPSEKMCDSPTSSHGSMLDSPATPSAALASPAAPAATHSEQAQPLSLTTKPEGRMHHHFSLPGKASGSTSSSSSSSQPAVSIPSGTSGSQSSTPILTRPIPFTSLHPSMLSPPSPFHQAALHSHHSLFQSQPLSLVTKPTEWIHTSYFLSFIVLYIAFLSNRY